MRLPAPGVYAVTVRVRDRAGNRGESAPVAIRVPSPAGSADTRVGALPTIGARGASRPAPT